MNLFDTLSKMQQIIASIDDLKYENKRLEKENSVLKTENAALKSDLKDAQNKLFELYNTIAKGMHNKND